jgi:hypothetical protein
VRKGNRHLKGRWKDLLQDASEEEIKVGLSSTPQKTAPGLCKDSLGLYAIAVALAQKDDSTVVDLLSSITNWQLRSGTQLDMAKEVEVIPIWKKQGCKDANNIRFISLQNSLPKLTSKILAKRLAVRSAELEAFHTAQEGYQPDKGTYDAVNVVLDCMEDARRGRKDMFLTLYDCSKAYDLMEWYLLEDGLDALHVDDDLKRFLLSRLEGVRSCVRTGRGRTGWVDNKRGVPQGDPLAPWMFLVGMNLLLVIGLETK